MVIKLGDLGCSIKSDDRTADHWQYGMTVFCMATGEKFGSRKYRPESVPEFCKELQEVCSGGSLAQVPDLLRDVYPQKVSMDSVRDLPWLQGVSFFDQDSQGFT